jgi:hypothetical protein
MGSCDHRAMERFARVRPRWLLALVGVGAAAALVALGATFAARAQTQVSVVPLRQPVDGRTYAQWEVQWWKRVLSLTSHSVPCSTGQHGLVWFLERQAVCTVPATDYILIGTPSAECSTVEKPPYYATTDNGLLRCARRNWREGVYGTPTVTVTVDGERVPTFRVTTPVFRFVLPRKNLLDTRKRRGRARAYGANVMLRPLPAGPHTVRVTAAHWVYRSLTYRLTVK